MSPEQQSTTRRVIFECTCNNTRWGEVVRLVGSAEALGGWNASRGVLLNTTRDTYPRWRSNVIDLSWSQKGDIEFKFVKCKLDGTHVQWEGGPNRKLCLRDVPRQDLTAVVKGSFDKAGLQFATSSTSAPIPSFLSQDSRSDTPLTRADSDFQFSSRWEGLPTSKVAISRLATFDESLRGPSEQNVLDAFLKECPNARSFLQKLKLIQKQSDYLARFVKKNGDVAKADGTLFIKSTGEALRLLIAIYAFLHFTRTGVVPCAEDGGHFRPSQHATASAVIFENLISMEDSLGSQGRRESELGETMNLIIRRILPLLPSFAESFTCAVPLTRIRDIAHRNDIPQELKYEIKHTLQNKLHRCAGPEDLVTTERLLKKILQTGTYPREFVSEFRIFHEELKEFFNATSLVRRLDALRATHTEPEFITVANDFLSRKAILSNQATTQQLVEALIHSVFLRKSLLGFLARGDVTLRQTESILLTDIATEQFAFTLVSRLANATTENAAWGSLPLADARWTCALQTLLCALSHVQLSQFQTEECEALIAMISVLLDARGALAFSSKLTTAEKISIVVLTERDQQLILNSLLSRVVRLTEVYTDQVTSVAPAVVRSVGNSMQASSAAVEIFAEAEVRASMVFQVSRLSSSLLNQVAALLGYHGVEVIVHPEWKSDSSSVSPIIVGTLIDLDDLWTLPTAVQNLRAARKGPLSVIVRLAKATGDEEVGGLREQYGVRAIMLLHPIPHLSHLSIRARQEKLPFVSVVNPQAQLISQSQALVGSEVKLTFTPEGVELVKCDEAAASFYRRQSSLGMMRCRSSSRASLSFRPPSPLSRSVSTVDSQSLPPDSIGPEDPIPVLTSADGLENLEVRAGAKAAACARLSALSSECGGLFTAPESFVLPFGSMEAVLMYHGVLGKYTKLLEDLDGSVANIQDEVLDELAETIRQLVGKGLPSRGNLSLLIAKLKEHCSGGAPVEDVPFIVRSSANVEDLAGLSAAGLYESILNVNPFRDIEGFAQSICAVWASLHSRRAILSRKYAQVTQSLARMAVLVQNLAAPYMSLIINTKSPIPPQSLEVLLGNARASIRKAQASDRGDGVTASASDDDWLYFEAAIGLGEVLASAGIVRGSPYQVLANMRTKEYLVLGYASFAVSYHSTTKPEEQQEEGQVTAARFVDERITDYTQDLFCFNEFMKDSVVAKVIRVASFLQLHFHTPQDIEGAIVLSPEITEETERRLKGATDAPSRVASLQQLKISEDDFDLVVVQTRPQPL